MAKKVIKKVEVVEEPIKEIEEVKKKRVMSKEQLEHLARIRELASAKKKELKERDSKVRNVEKEALELKAIQYDKIQEEKAKLKEVVKPKEIIKKPKIVVKDDSSDDDNNDDSSSEEEEIIQKKKQSHKHKQKKITDYDDENIHKLAFQASQHKLMEKVMSNRILGNLTNYSSQMGMKYY